MTQKMIGPFNVNVVEGMKPGVALIGTWDTRGLRFDMCEQTRFEVMFRGVALKDIGAAFEIGRINPVWLGIDMGREDETVGV